LFQDNLFTELPAGDSFINHYLNLDVNVIDLGLEYTSSPMSLDSPYPIQRLFRRLAAWRPVVVLEARIMPHLDRFTLERSHGKYSVGGILTGLPIISLTTIGAKSGMLRLVPLVGIPEGDGIILVASCWGGSHHPAWYYNLKSNPSVMVMRNGQNKPFLAREIDGGERERFWKLAIEQYPGYANYQQQAGPRRIPVIFLSPH